MVVASPASLSWCAAAALVSLLSACPAAANFTGHLSAFDPPIAFKQGAAVGAKVAAVAKPVQVQTREQFAALQRGTPNNAHHFLNRKQLASIDSIDCLHDKQRNPHKPCVEKSEESGSYGALRIGHYPHWTDRQCHSDQEFFCDPTQMLTPPDQHKATEQLRLFKDRTLVNCGQFESVMDPDLERRGYEKKHPIFTGRLGLEDYRSFNLAVMLADEWPKEEMDPQSMRLFGRVVMTEWGLMPIYNGVDNGNPASQYHNWDEYHSNCPNTAVLFILPKYHEAYLISPSCEFICASRGGPEVIAATLAGLDRGGVEEAIHAGIEQIEKVLKITIPQSIQQLPVKRQSAYSATKDMMKSDATFVWAIRFAYAFVVFLAVFFTGSCIYFTLLPESKQRRSRNLFATDGRREILALRAETIES